MSNQDIAAQGITKVFDFEVRPCTMHQSNKIAASYLVNLTRSCKKVTINPFLEGELIMQKLRN